MSEAFASAWSLMKAPIYEPDFDLEPGFTVWDMPPHEEERQQQFNHLFPNYMKTPLQGETYGGLGDVYWTSKDDMARGSATINPNSLLSHRFPHGQSRPNDVFLHHFEVAEPLREKGKAQAYLQEMIDELKHRARHHDVENPMVHATKVDWELADFWNKMVDRGLISSASERREPRYTFDGQHIAPRIFDDKLIPVDRLGVNE